MLDCERRTETSDEALAERIEVALHQLCQPLTVLQCKLALGELIDDPHGMRDAIRAGMVECARLNGTIDAMRSVLQEAMESKREPK